MKQVVLPGIKESTKDYEAIERMIKEAFKREIYKPILKEFNLTKRTIKNDMPGLKDAIPTGRITFKDGTFSGQLNSTISKELRDLGARFDKVRGVYRIPFVKLPLEVRHMISMNAEKFQEKILTVDKILQAVAPEELAARLDIAHYLYRAIMKVETQFNKSVKSFAMAPKLSEVEMHRIAAEWRENLDLNIVNFAKEEIVSLRNMMKETVYAGNRYGSVVKAIQKSYGVTENKAKFLARQETGLLMAKYKEVRYASVGVTHYKWTCVTGTKLHPVRPSHQALNGKVFEWKDPPITSMPGEPQKHNNPGQDYNCRCYARPIVNYA